VIDPRAPRLHQSDVQERIKLLQRMEQLDVRRNELLQDIVDAAIKRLIDLGTPEVAAQLVAHDLADLVAEQWGGQSLSFPRDRDWFLSQRDLEYYDRWDRGAKLHELTRDSGMTERGMRFVLERIQRKLRRQSRKDQTDLFHKVD
jgi:Mor family transcriptional regulator